MKKIFLILLALSLLVAVPLTVFAVQKECRCEMSSYAHTHATILTLRGTALAAIHNTSDFSDAYKQYINAHLAAAFPEAELMGDATPRYNSNSYVWYGEPDSNNYWIDDPSVFINDGSYYEISSPTDGCIVAYMKGNEIYHSGIVESVSSAGADNVCGDANRLTVISKWGEAGLYRHNGVQCPYVRTYGGEATSVKYYVPQHGHTYSCSYSDLAGHTGKCTVCGYEEAEAHHFTVSLDNNDEMTCAECGFTTVMSTYVANYECVRIDGIEPSSSLGYCLAVLDNGATIRFVTIQNMPAGIKDRWREEARIKWPMHYSLGV